VPHSTYPPLSSSSLPLGFFFFDIIPPSWVDEFSDVRRANLPPLIDRLPSVFLSRPFCLFYSRYYLFINHTFGDVLRLDFPHRIFFRILCSFWSSSSFPSFFAEGFCAPLKKPTVLYTWIFFLDPFFFIL